MPAARKTTAPAAKPPEAEQPATQPAIAAPDGAEAREQLVAAIATFQRDCPPIGKTKTATVPTKTGGSYSYTYADLGDILNAIRPHLAANGLALTQHTTREPTGPVLVTTISHVAGGAITSEVDLGQSPSNPQQFGGALTYLRRYELTTLLGIAAEEDRDAQDVQPPGQRPAELPVWAQPAGDPRKAEWRAILEPLIGKRRAGAAGKAIADTWGALPDGAVSIAKVIAAHLEAELGPCGLDEAKTNASDRREAEAAQAAAEQPDAPAPDDGDIPSDAGPPPPGTGGDLSVDEIEARRAAAAEPEPEPPAVAERQDPEVAPATVPLPIEQLVEMDSDDERRQLLRGLGCSCPDPLGPENGKDQACPIVGHGIPF